jgi:hypothetical protein
VPHKRYVLRSFAALGAIAVSAANAQPAAADHSLQAVTVISTGYSDNVQAVPDNPVDETTPTVSSDAFANIAPGVIFAHNGQRITQVLRYTLNIRLYAEASGANSFSNSLLYGAVMPLSPRAGLTFEAGAAHGRQNAFDTAPQDTPAAGQAQGDQSFAQGGAGVGFNYQLTPSWQYQHSLGMSIYQPTDDSVQIGRRLSFTTGIGLAKTFQYHSFTLTGRGTYSTLDNGEDEMGRQIPDSETVLFGPELRWVHDLSEDFSTDAMIGLTIAAPANDFSRRSEYPVGAAYLRFARDRYAAAIGYRRNVATNIILGETEATHIGEVRGVVPLPLAERLSMAGAVAYSNGESIGIVGAQGQDLTGTTVQWVGDVSVAWQIAEALSASIRYQRVWQDRTDPRVPTPDGMIVEQHTRRQQITLVFEGRYPTRTAAELPKDPSTRVDSNLQDQTKREDSLVR